MSFVRCGSRVHHVELRPSAVRSPALLLIHALGTSLRIWDGVVERLSFGGPLLRYDLCGHGLSEVADAPCDSASLARDALGLLDQLGIESAVVCGLSVGGIVAQELALAAPARVRAAILCGTAARIGTRDGWQIRIDQVRAGGIASIADASMPRWFSPRYRELEPDAVRGYRCQLERTPEEGYLAMARVLAEADLTERVRGVHAPVLVVSGELDEATTPAEGRTLAGLIPGARFELLAGTSHLLCVERPAELAGLIDGFIQSIGVEKPGRDAPGREIPGRDTASRDTGGHDDRVTGAPWPSDEPFERGLAERRAVLGSAHVDRALGAASDFDRDFQAYITRAAWGEIWARPGLPRHTRHLLTIAMLAATGREEELAMHLAATVNTGVTEAEVREVLMQVAVYAGVPAANSAIKTARRVFADIDRKKGA
jgi:3-oxoadipate enol-lactonase/4-carboxymuconolactone decarboxylase